MSCTMSRILGRAIFFLLSYMEVLVWAQDVSEKFNQFGVVPDVIPVAPSELLDVVYPGGVRVLLGNQLEATQMVIAPSVDFDADPDSFYTLAMVDPDVPSRNLPLLREFLHWLVGNIPGSDVARGDTLALYVPPTPPPASGPHRYVFLVYRQPGRIEFDKSLLDFTTNQLRANTSINRFAMKNGLGNPLFGCFCQVGILPIQLL